MPCKLDIADIIVLLTSDEIINISLISKLSDKKFSYLFLVATPNK